MSKSLQFTADTIDGQIQETPQVFYFPCDKVIPLGTSVVKSFDESMNIVAKRVFVVQYGSRSFGSCQFQSFSDFDTYLGSQCQCCPCTECFVLINGCFIEINGCVAQICGCQFFPEINGCGILINGCQASLN